MNTKTLSNWLKYYRASLIDGNRAEHKNTATNQIVQQESKLHHISEKEMKQLWSKERIQKKSLHPALADGSTENSDEVELVDVNRIEIAPIALSSQYTHGRTRRNNTNHFPFWIPALVTEDGQLYPPEEDATPIFIRAYLFPTVQGFPEIATMDDLDKHLRNKDFKCDNWQDYWEKCS